MLVRSKNKLLIQLKQIKTILCFSRLLVDGFEEAADEFDHLRQCSFVGIIVRCVLEDCFKKKGIPSKSCGWFCEISIEFKFARLWSPLDFLE